jgi:hypothetical protein
LLRIKCLGLLERGKRRGRGGGRGERPGEDAVSACGSFQKGQDAHPMRLQDMILKIEVPQPRTGCSSISSSHPASKTPRTTSLTLCRRRSLDEMETITPSSVGVRSSAVISTSHLKDPKKRLKMPSSPAGAWDDPPSCSKGPPPPAAPRCMCRSDTIRITT